MTILSLSRNLSRSLSRPMPVLRHLAARFHHVAGLRRSRIGLSRLDDHLLADIGLSRHDAETEAARRLWDAPVHWWG